MPDNMVNWAASYCPNNKQMHLCESPWPPFHFLILLDNGYMLCMKEEKQELGLNCFDDSSTPNYFGDILDFMYVNYKK